MPTGRGNCSGKWRAGNRSRHRCRFDAWLIEHTETAIGAGYIGRADTWYAPAIGWNVRYKSWTETPPGGASSEWQLQAARVGQREYPQTVSAR